MSDTGDKIHKRIDDVRDVTAINEESDFNPFVTELILPKSEKEALAKQRELVRQQCVALYSKSPLYQARAVKDPDYWKNFSTGRVNLIKE